MQLTVLGYILVPIFTYELWYLVVAYAFFMLLIGSWEASSRPAYTYTVSRFLIHICMVSNHDWRRVTFVPPGDDRLACYASSEQGGFANSKLKCGVPSMTRGLEPLVCRPG